MVLKAVEGQDPGTARTRRRRRSRKRRSRSGTFGHVLPSLLTTGNLAAGFFAIVKASTGEPLVASYAVFVAAVFDVLDGRAARLLGNESRFGAEYDSIADTVSFGVAPAVIAFHGGGLIDLGWAGWVMAFVYTACGSLRLARFNVTTGRFRGRFDGLPSPAAAGMVVSTVWFYGFLQSNGIGLQLPAVLPAIGLMILGLLMVSPIPYHSFKEVDVRGSYSAIVIVVVVSILLLIEPGLNFFLLAVVYTVSGPIAWWWRKRVGQSLESSSDSAQAHDSGDEESATR